MSKLSQQQLTTMLNLQSKLNNIVNINWLSADLPFLRAVFIECAEAIEHLGWKWWKQQNANIVQVQIELVDILHFYLSDTLVEYNGSIEDAAKEIFIDINTSVDIIIFDSKDYIISEMNTHNTLELIAGLATVRRRSFYLLNHAMHLCNMSWHSTYIQYVSKNVLNIFRQDNGYKDGTYIKIWNGQEDNEYLAEAITKLDHMKQTFADDLYKELTTFYMSLKTI